MDREPVPAQNDVRPPRLRLLDPGRGRSKKPHNGDYSPWEVSRPVERPGGRYCQGMRNRIRAQIAALMSRPASRPRAPSRSSLSAERLRTPGDWALGSCSADNPTEVACGMTIYLLSLHIVTLTSLCILSNIYSMILIYRNKIHYDVFPAPPLFRKVQ